jgi:hypothetical protein
VGEEKEGERKRKREREEREGGRKKKSSLLLAFTFPTRLNCLPVSIKSKFYQE